MSFAPTSPVTGAPQTGFTSPTYTLTQDTAPSPNGKQYAVTALGGTQTGVEVHSVSKPFTVTCFRPAQFKTLPAANPITGILKNVPMNTTKCLTRKGMLPAANQIPVVGYANTELKFPAGADSADPAAIRALLSLHFGVVWQQAGGIGDLVVTGIL